MYVLLRQQKMEMMIKFWKSYGIAMLVVVLAMSDRSWAQDTSCLNQLMPCMSYLDGTRDVPDTCCDPLKSVIKSNPQCLCGLISNQGSTQAEQAGINVTEAQQLPGKCGQHVNPLTCLTGSSGPRSSAPDSSGGAFLLQSKSLMVAVVSCMIVQILWASNTVIA